MTHTHRWLLLALTVALAGCSHYASVAGVRPKFRPLGATTGLLTTAEQGIVTALKKDRSEPLMALAGFLTAAETASQELARNPGNDAARETYNFAVARLFTTLHHAKLDPWTQPLRVPAAGGDFVLHYTRDPRPQYDAALYDLTPADEFDIKGKYVTERTIKPGLGAPLVAVGKEKRRDAVETFSMERTYYSITALARFENDRRCVLSFHDPLATETVALAGRSFPLAANFTVPLAVMLAREEPKKLELSRALRPEKYAKTARIARLQPYDPDKIVVLVTHGLVDSPATWAPMINHLRGDPEIRRRYQFWFFSYPSGYPYPYSAAILREQLDAIQARYPLRHKIVLIGHSMGGLISRLMVTDSGDTLWMASFGKPPAQTRLSPATRAQLEKSLIFRPREEVDRVIFMASPHRGSDMATNWFGRFASRLIKTPSTLLSIGQELRQIVVDDPTALRVKLLPNSVDTLAPNNRFVKTINTLPITPGIPYHSIIGDRGKGGNKDHTRPVSSDGIVPYWSSHLEGAQSELIVPSNHSAHQHPQAIAEVARLLHLHARATRKAPSPSSTRTKRP